MLFLTFTNVSVHIQQSIALVLLSSNVRDGKMLILNILFIRWMFGCFIRVADAVNWLVRNGKVLVVLLATLCWLLFGLYRCDNPIICPQCVHYYLFMKVAEGR